MTASPDAPFNFEELSAKPGPSARTPQPYRRHALGLPAGSVRALLTFMVLGLIWALLLLPKEKTVAVPLYLHYLMFLILGHYFAARGQAPDPAAARAAPPLYLPRGSIRFLIVLGFAAVIGWGLYQNPDYLERLQPSVDEVVKQPYLPLVLLGAFFLGILLACVSKWLLAGPQGLPAWFQDIQAWLSLLAMLGLGAEFLIQLVINPNLAPERRLPLPEWQGFLSAFVAFYFGLRS